MIRWISLAAALVASLLFATSALADEHLVAKQGGVYAGKTLVYPFAPTINDAGLVAFESGYKDASGVRIGGGVFLWDPATGAESMAVGTGSTVAGRTLYGAADPALNDVGQVVFISGYPDGASAGQGLFIMNLSTGAGTLVLERGDTVGGRTVGTIRFPTVNDAGRILCHDNTQRIYSRDPVTGTWSIFAEAGTVIGGTTLCYATYPSIDDAGDVVFTGSSATEDNGIYSSTVRLVGPGSLIDGHTVQYCFRSSISDGAGVVFDAVTSESSWFGIYNLTKALFRRGDTVAGLVIGSAFDPAINDAGQMAFMTTSVGFTLMYVDPNEVPTADAGSNVTIDSADQATTTINGTAEDADGDTLTCRWLEGTTVLAGPTTLTGSTCALDLSTLSTLSLGDHTLTLEISDGSETVTDTMVLTVSNSAPTSAPAGAGCYELGAGNSITLSGNVADFDGDTLTYEWREQGSATAIASGTIATSIGGAAAALTDATVGTTTLGLGVHTIELAVDDGTNDEVVATIDVEIKDTTGPTLALDCSKTILWPPNHQMVAVTVDPNAADEGGAVTITASVVSNEPTNGTGDGDATPDWDGITVNATTGVVNLDLRAERSGSGTGRIYTVTITATDGSGNVSVATCEILVPKSKGKSN